MMTDVYRGLSEKNVLLNLELARQVREFAMPANALLADLAPSARIYGFGASEMTKLALRRNQAEAKYPQWHKFWDDSSDPKRKEQARQLVQLIGRVYVYILGEERVKWIADKGDAFEFSYVPTVQDIQKLPVEILAQINGVTLNGARFLKCAFGEEDTVDVPV